MLESEHDTLTWDLFIELTGSFVTPPSNSNHLDRLLAFQCTLLVDDSKQNLCCRHFQTTKDRHQAHDVDKLWEVRDIRIHLGMTCFGGPWRPTHNVNILLFYLAWLIIFGGQTTTYTLYKRWRKIIIIPYASIATSKSLRDTSASTFPTLNSTKIKQCLPLTPCLTDESALPYEPWQKINMTTCFGCVPWVWGQV